MDDLGAPTSYLALTLGTAVIDAAGERIGTVEHVLSDEAEDVFDGIVVDVRAGPGGMRFADADQVDRLYERGVVLKVGKDELHTPSANPAVLGADPADEGESRLTGRLHRAWDWISGRY